MPVVDLREDAAEVGGKWDGVQNWPPVTAQRCPAENILSSAARGQLAGLF